MAVSVFKWLQYPKQDGEEGQWQTHPRWKTAEKLVIEASRSDPIGTILLAKLRLNPIGIFLLVILGVASIQGLALLLYYFIPGLKVATLVRFLYLEWPIFALSWVVIPFILAFYPWVVRTTGHLYAGLYMDGVLARDEKELCALVDSVKDRICNKRWTYAAISLTLASLAVMVSTGLFGRQDWAETPGIAFDVSLYYVILLPGVSLAGYIIFIIIARELATVHSLFRLFNENTGGQQAADTVNVRPWHPDRCGGLGRLNRYATRFSYFIASVAVGLLFFTYFSISKFEYNILDSVKNDPGLWVAIVAYVILAPALFFLTLGSASRAMRREKVKRLGVISEQLDTEYEITQQLYAGHSIELNSSAQKVRLLHELYVLTDRFPVWPFDAASIRRFTTAWIAPFVPVAFSLIIKLYSG